MRIISVRSLSILTTLLFGCVGEIGSSTPSPPNEGREAPDHRDTSEPPDRPDDPDVVAPIAVALSAPQVRVLSAPEYRNTVRDLLGLSVSPHLAQSDWTAGFDNGAGIHIDENLLSALITEAEALATQYIATRAASDFPCFNLSDITDACMQTLIEQLGRRAHRRPLTSEQRSELFAFFSAVSNDVNSRQTGAEMVVARLLTSPQFLYRTEVGRPTTPGGDLYALDDFEKASLIAYTLTGSMPDELLLADAEAEMLDDANLRRHIQRLWASTAARERVGDFFRQWLKVTRLDEMARRPSDYPKLTAPDLGRSLKDEFDAFVRAVVFDGEGTLRALFEESFTHIDVNTAPLYGLTTNSDTPVRVALDAAERRGVLTLASTMAAIASATDAFKDRPVLRGLMIKEQLLCEEVGPPSGINTIAAMNTAMQTPNFDQLTTREQYEAMMQQGDHCRACHRQFMPLGFALGRYDALGRYRTEHNGRPINAAVSDVPFDGRAQELAGGTALAAALATSPSTAKCFSKNFVAFTVGATDTEHTATLSGSVLQKLGSGPLAVARFVEETLATPELYQRHGVPFVDVDAGSTGTDGGTEVTRSVLLASGASLNPDESVTSADGVFRLVYQLDGNLVLYGADGAAPWASNTSGQSTGRTAMQGDGNLVVYDRDGAPRFNTGTYGNPGAQLFIDSEGTLTIISTDDRVLWTGGRP
jgi:hypothetical protein